MFNRSCAVDVNGCLTDIVLKEYNNRTFLIVTQFRKFGPIVVVSHENLTNEHRSKVFSTKTIFGKEDDEILAAARYIAEQINIEKPLLASLCLKKYDTPVLTAIVTAVKQIKTW